MSFLAEFQKRLPPSLQKQWKALDSPVAIQAYLDQLPYIGEERDRSPLNVMLDSQAHCLDGGFWAALALWHIGFRPLVIDLVPEPGEDDDHVLAVYRLGDRWGAIAKSNYVNLGFREAVHRDLRELAMTYFEHYCSIHKKKTLRGYTRPLDAGRFESLHWAWDEAGANRLYKMHFYGRKSIPLIPASAGRRLSPMTDRGYAAATMFTNLSESFGNRKDTTRKTTDDSVPNA
jgi:hypothetical protein